MLLLGRNWTFWVRYFVSRIFKDSPKTRNYLAELLLEKRTHLLLAVCVTKLMAKAGLRLFRAFFSPKKYLVGS
jgi:hypothetical protein